MSTAVKQQPLIATLSPRCPGEPNSAGTVMVSRNVEVAAVEEPDFGRRTVDALGADVLHKSAACHEPGEHRGHQFSRNPARKRGRSPHLIFNAVWPAKQWLRILDCSIVLLCQTTACVSNGW